MFTAISKQLISVTIISAICFGCTSENDKEPILWKKVNGIESVYLLTAMDSSLWISTSSGLYMSTNNGISWISRNNDLPMVHSLKMVQNQIFAATDGGIFISTDNGLNWTSFGLVSQQLLVLEVIDTFIVTGSGSPLYRKSINDYGSNWEEYRVTEDLYFGGFNCLLVVNDTIYGGASSGVYVSSDIGTTWDTINSGLSEYSKFINILHYDGNCIYGGSAKGVSKSTNYGTNWIEKNTGLDSNINGRTVILSINSKDNVFLCGAATQLYRKPDNSTVSFSGGIYISTNNGDTWIENNNGIPTIDEGAYPSVESIIIINDEIFIALGSYGLYKSKYSLFQNFN